MIDPAGLSEASEPASNSWSIHGVRLSTCTMAAHQQPRGGDWCEAFAVSDELLAISIGDVCGHGDEKFAAMTATSRAIREAACSGLDPAQTLIAGHRFLRGFDPGEYATAVFGLLNLRDRTLAFANAGHPPPLMASPQDARFLSYPYCDLPLGIDDPFRPALRVLTIPPSSVLVLYTDGVTEHARKPVQGADELLDAAIFARTCWEQPAASVIEQYMFLSDANLDDFAILTAWTPPAPGTARTPTKLFERPT
jgi:serine phosphatase RsbU (regulator of sigma subunit)